MKLVHGLYNLDPELQASVVTIGNFDGMHLGHRQLIEALEQSAAHYKVPSVLMTFEPQPNEYFKQPKPVPRLMRLRDKVIALQKTSVDYMLCLRFCDALAALTPEEFVQQILVDALNIKAVIVGDDFRFGAKRAGDAAFLREAGMQFGFEVIELPSFVVKDERVSSTRIREALGQADLKLAEKLLGAPYSVWGRVGFGDQRGRELGFPTANIYLHREWVPVAGIYVIRVHGLGDVPIDGVADVGIRPTYGGTRVLLEAHLLDFNENLYGKNIKVEFLHKLRDEEKYDTSEALIEQIKIDVQNTRDYFADIE